MRQCVYVYCTCGWGTSLCNACISVVSYPDPPSTLQEESQWNMKSTLVLDPRPSKTRPFNLPRGKGGLVNIVQHFCTSLEFQRHNLIGLYGNYLTRTQASLILVTYPDPTPKRKGGSGEYSTASHHGCCCGILLKAKPLKLLVGLQ